MKLAVVIPTYNERETLPSLIEELLYEIKKIAEKFSIVIVDDASPDGTGQIAEELNKKYDNISVIHRKSKLGLGSAYKEGFRFALDRFQPDFIVQMDADHSHDPKEISLMLQNMHGFDFIVASRHVLGASVIGWGAYRKLLHSTAGTLAAICGGLKISDPTSGFRAFKNNVLSSVDFTKIKSDGFAFQIEILCLLKRMGFRGFEFPTVFVNRKDGKSKMGINESIQFIKTCVRLLMKRI
ncbi:MAG: polyprenol monophosphomannose synthase [Nitrosopumilaceae archaeon]